MEAGFASPGQLQRERLGEILRDDDGLLLLDEPTNHLDAASIQSLQEALERWPGGLVVATHDERLARAVCPEKWMLQAGRLVQGP